MVFNRKNDAIKFVNDYSLMIFVAKRKAVKRERLKILTLKQILQRFPIALAQVKAGNTSENLLN